MVTQSANAAGPSGDAPRGRCPVDPRNAYIRLRRGTKGGKGNVLDSGWGEGGNWTRDIGKVRRHAERGGNLAVLTGKRSGHFTIDVDPKNGGMDTLEALEAEYGPLPRDNEVATPSDGSHLNFSVAGLDFEVGNDTAGKALGPGIDIKGEYGYRVAPGSATSSGVYTQVHGEVGGPYPEPPEWLVEKLRLHFTGRAERAAERRCEALEEVEKVSAPAECCEALVARAVAGIEAKMDRLARLPEGKKITWPGKQEKVGWDEGYWLAAARLIEIARWRYASFTMEQARKVFDAHVPGQEGGFDPEHKWERGLYEAGGWLKGNTHRIEEHGPGYLDKATGRLLSPVEVQARAEVVEQYAMRAEPPQNEAEKFETEVAEQVRRLKVAEEARLRFAEDKSDPTIGWEPLDLATALDAGPVLPDVGRRSDGVGVFYSGKLNSIYGESEGGKTWLALDAAVRVMSGGEADDVPGEVFYFDYEDDDRAIAQRLLSMNVPRSMILEQFHYVNPQGPFTDKAFEHLKARLANGRVRLVVIDATTEALAVEGLDSNSDIDIADFYNRYPKRIAALGPAVVVIDHVTKAVEGRSQQVGSQFKKAGIDGVAYNVEPLDRFTKGQGGSSMVLIGKDKQGGVREHGVFGGEGKQARFGFFVMDECGSTRLNTVKPAETKIDKQIKKFSELETAIREYLGTFKDGELLPGVRKVGAYLREEHGMKVSTDSVSDILKTVKAERKGEPNA